ncbi:hypothetical protein [Pseudarthrobacter phenanthrenivorans]|uniref:hypothetical protein n=1 Tax=Pseudarthrobacter phenanthrenivorans TaxID=361575 RepID=UPI001FE498DD|nr:hypothetical protein [Pseudarthrobacter phenanthrenivorans]
MSFDRVFLGADSVTVEDGICRSRPRPTRLKELMDRHGRNVYLADTSKLGPRAFPAWARLASPRALVTDDGADPEHVQKFRDAGVEVEVAAVKEGPR